MPQNNNYEVYNRKMNISITDKCWWVDEIPEDIDTVIDYGCATGELFVHLESNWPGRFKNFIGIDNNEKMLQIANQNFPKGKYYSNLKDVEPISKAILVLNSVIHEILNYDGFDSLLNIFHHLNENHISYIAIREMFPQNPDKNTIIAAEDFQMPEKFQKQWKEFCACRPSITKTERLQEFILKYSYVENWERECKERYLWHWDAMFKDTLPDYKVIREFSFSIHQQKERIKKDFKLDWPLDTHKKMLLKRTI